MELYLITGFLGAGKTTLLKNLIGLMSGRKLKVIVNEFGKAGIDGTLLKELGVAVGRDRQWVNLLFLPDPISSKRCL